ncbi:hypothetical protein ACTFIR_009477 [Dictyostelium discoideum]
MNTKCKIFGCSPMFGCFETSKCPQGHVDICHTNHCDENTDDSTIDYCGQYGCMHTPGNPQTPTQTQTQTQTPTPTPTQSPTQTPNQTQTQILTQTPTQTQAPTQTPSQIPTQTPIQSPMNCDDNIKVPCSTDSQCNRNNFCETYSCDFSSNTCDYYSRDCGGNPCINNECRTGTITN